jgi:CRP-like cAMP-binding protein
LHHQLRGDFDIRNRVLLSLRPEAWDYLQPRLITKRLAPGQIVYEEDAPFTHAIFPHEGVISLNADLRNGRGVEKASIGYEGFLGITLVMGGAESMSQCAVVVPGYASWLPIDELDEAIARFPCVRHAMLRYAKCLITQLLESVACNSLHSAEERLARWLLHADDRIVDGSLQVTQATLSQSLGLRRATVNIVCTKMMDDGAITYARGEMRLLDRELMKQRACGCYGRVSLAFERNSQPIARFMEGLPPHDLEARFVRR